MRFHVLTALTVTLLAAPASGQSSRVALANGLVIVTVVNRPDQGDYESVKEIIGLASDGFAVAFVADMPSGQRSGGTRRVRREDQDHARQYAMNFHGGEQAAWPGTTPIGVSRAVLSDLRIKGTARLGVWAPGIDGKGDLLYEGTLERVGTESFEVLLDQKPARLPALRARARLHGGTWWTSLFGVKSEFWFLDDPDNPLSLRVRLGAIGDLDVTQIRNPATQNVVEDTLNASGGMRVYGIHFDFGSDRIRPQSEAVLADIADALARHPRWRLRVEGHTDGVGLDADNQRLSERRAEAVRQALVQRYQIAPSRLTAAGFGRLRPVESNGTIHGRALNRRVELIRE